MKTKGEFAIVIRGSTERTSKVALSSWSGFTYLMQQLVTGYEVAPSEFPYYGLDVQLVSAKRDPWDHGTSDPCIHDWVEVTSKVDDRRRWQCARCDAEILKPR